MSSKNYYLTAHPTLEASLHALKHGVAAEDTAVFLRALDGFIEEATADALAHEGEYGMHKRGAAIALRQIRSLVEDADMKSPAGANAPKDKENPLGGTY